MEALLERSRRLEERTEITDNIALHTSDIIASAATDDARNLLTSLVELGFHKQRRIIVAWPVHSLSVFLYNSITNNSIPFAPPV